MFRTFHEERSDDLNIVRRKGTDRNVLLPKCPLQQILFQENDITLSGTRRAAENA